MQAVTVAEAQRELPNLMELVKAGEDVIITRQGMPIARLVQTKPQHEEISDLKRALAELADMRINQALN
ncbi:MAG: type II toxin-antitoxin system prevent-host-death family antitoxin [Sulfuricellaceae bacterium]